LPEALGSLSAELPAVLVVVVLGVLVSEITRASVKAHQRAIARDRAGCQG
jgi:uncharacterized protein YejL (UPF0352 family)